MPDTTSEAPATESAPALPLIPELQTIADGYENTIAAHENLYAAFEAGIQRNPCLRAHRDFVERGDHGYGDRAFHYMWKLLVEQMPRQFRFLEIGVFKGQVISLIRLLSDLTGKDPRIIGVTPLSSAGDQNSIHPDCDYLQAIEAIHDEFRLSLAATTLIRGFSQTASTLELAARQGPFDLLYIDGCHDLPEVVSDLTFYPQMLRPGGFLVVDDCSTLLELPPELFPGLWNVSLAAQEILDPDPRLTHLFACGHNRVWRRTAAAGEPVSRAIATNVVTADAGG